MLAGLVQVVYRDRQEHKGCLGLGVGYGLIRCLCLDRLALL